MNYKEFFGNYRNAYVDPKFNAADIPVVVEDDFTVEDLYQAFKARLMDEVKAQVDPTGNTGCGEHF